MEGRSQTLDYVRTPHRFELMLSQPLVIGQRRAAQRMMAAALSMVRVEAAPSEPTSRRLFLCGPGSGASPAGVAVAAEDKAEATTALYTNRNETVHNIIDISRYCIRSLKKKETTREKAGGGRIQGRMEEED